MPDQAVILSLSKGLSMFRVFGALLVFSAIFIIYFSTTEIHIIRHGEKLIEKGLQDAPLTDYGKGQAKAVGKRLVNKENKPPLIYVSPMRRARQTASIMNEQLRLPLYFDSRLTEKSYYQTKETYDDGTFKFSKHKNGIHETKEGHRNRLISFLKEKTSLLNKEIWIVAHGGLVVRIFEKISERTKTPLPRHLKLAYGSEFVFKYNKWTGNFYYMRHHSPIKR